MCAGSCEFNVDTRECSCLIVSALPSASFLVQNSSLCDNDNLLKHTQYQLGQKRGLTSNHSTHIHVIPRMGEHGSEEVRLSPNVRSNGTEERERQCRGTALRGPTVRDNGVRAALKGLVAAASRG